MIVYVVLPDNARPDLDQRIRQAFANDARQVTPTLWLVAANLTAQGVTERLGAEQGAFGRVIVASIDGYFGWHSKDIWDWIALQRGR